MKEVSFIPVYVIRAAEKMFTGLLVSISHQLKVQIALLALKRDLCIRLLLSYCLSPFV